MEDFFTLTEMKDGLTFLGRVEELVNLMQKEKDHAVMNVEEAIRHWSTVASTIAITQNKECLDHFLELDGLLVFKRWLMDAQKFCNGTNDSFVEEAVTALLQAIERLHVQHERLCFSGIWTTVKNLIGHKSSSVQDSARTLLDSWIGIPVERAVAVDGVSHGDEAQFKSDIDRKSGLLASTANDSKGPLSEGKERENNRIGNEQTSSDDLQMEEVAGKQRKSSIVQAKSLSSIDNACMENETSEASTGVRTPTKENVSSKEGQIIVPSESITSIEKCSSPNIKQGINEVMSNVDVTNDDGKATSRSKSSLEDSPSIEFLSSLTMQVGPGDSKSDASKVENSMNRLTSQTNIVVKDVNLFLKAASHGDMDTSTSDVKSGLVLCRAGGDVDPEITISHQKDLNLVEEDEEHAIEDDMNPGQEDEEPGSDEVEDMPDLSEILKPAMDSLDSDVIDKRSDIDLEYGYVDALKVARQVAKAVKKEVGKYGEPCSSYSEKMSDRSLELPSSPESINRQENRSPESQEEETSARLNTSVQASPITDANIISSDCMGHNKQDNNTHDIESSQVTEAAQEPQSNAEKGLCNFDLNEVCFEDAEHPSNPLSSSSTAAVSVVSASRAAAVHGLPVSPLQFKGTLGWKGSATTSAFRAASPRRIADTDKLSNGRASGSPKRTNNVIDIDLNVSEGVDDDTADLILGRQLPESFGFRSRESSVSPKRPRMLMLDLNQTDDDGDVLVSDGRMDSLLSNGRNGHINPSPASSSSSMPAFLKNIDLNDRPTINYDLSDQQPHFRKLASQYGSPYGGQRTVDPVISIMGTKVEVDRRDHIPQLMPLTSGKSPDTGMDIFSRNRNFQAVGPLMSYENSSSYGYSGLTQGPTMSFYSPGTPIPYMVDSRGAPIVPQIMGYAPAAAAFPPSYSHQQFITSMAGAPQPLNGAGPLHSNFNLNLGLTSDGMNTTRGSRPFLLPGDGRTTEDYLRPDLQPSSSGIGGKRKELDGGWEHYPFNMKHHQPPWR